MKRILFYSFMALFLGVILLPNLVFPGVPRALFNQLPFGWWHFLGRNLPELTMNWTLVATGCLCSVFAVAAGHWLMKGIWLQAQSLRRKDLTAGPWRWKWTLGLYAAIWLLFAIAFGAAGVFRQSTWLIQEEGPWYHSRSSTHIRLLQADAAIEQMILETGGDVEKARGAWLAERGRGGGFFEEFTVVFYGDRQGVVRDYVIIPRNPELGVRGLFCASSSNRSDTIRPISELSATLATLEGKYSGKP
jgi:hypothetical protein